MLELVVKDKIGGVSRVLEVSPEDPLAYVYEVAAEAFGKHVEAILLKEEDTKVIARDDTIIRNTSLGAADCIQLTVSPAHRLREKGHDPDALFATLCLAVYSGDVEVAELCFEAGVEPVTRSEAYHTPTHFACVPDENLSTAALEMLERHGWLDVHSNGEFGHRPLHVAAGTGHTTAAAFLLQRYASVRALDAGGWTPMHHAAAAGHAKVVRLLLENGAHSRTSSDAGFPLHLTHDPAVQALLVAAAPTVTVGSEKRQHKQPLLHYQELEVKCKSLTYYAQGPGTGKSFAIEKGLREGRWGGVGTVVVRVDIDGTTCDVGRQLRYQLQHMYIRAGATTVVVMYVGFDSNCTFVTEVLEHLVFTGQVEDGLAVVELSAPWHLVVEFQDPPQRTQTAREDVKKMLGRCSAVALEGSLYDYDVGAHEQAREALAFIRRFGDRNQTLDDAAFACLLTLGINLQPPDKEWKNKRHELLSCCTPRQITRALKALIEVYSSNYRQPHDVKAFAAMVLPQCIRQFINPSQDYFHTCGSLSLGVKPFYAQLSGQPCEAILTAVKNLEQSYETCFALLRQSQDVRTLEREDIEKQLVPKTSFSSLLQVQEATFKETCLRIPSLVTQHVAIAENLRKLMQIRSHINVGDAVLLEDPSGTGDSCLIDILRECGMLEGLARARVKSRELSLWNLVTSNSELRQLFSDNQPDADRVLWRAFSVNPNKQCLHYLLQAGEADSVEHVLLELRDKLLPVLIDEGPECTDGIEAALAAVRNESTDATVLWRRLTEKMSPVTRIQADRVMRSTLFAVAAGAVHMKEELLQILNRKIHVFPEWIRRALRKAGVEKQDQFCWQVKKLLAKNLQDNVTPLEVDMEFRMMLAVPCKGTPEKMEEEMAELVRRFLGLDERKSSIKVCVGKEMTSVQLFEVLLPILELARTHTRLRVVVELDLVNGNHLLSLVKRVVVDRYWGLWRELHPESDGTLPETVSFAVCGVTSASLPLSLQEFLQNCRFPTP